MSFRKKLLNIDFKNPCVILNTSELNVVLFLDLNELNLPKTCSTEFPDPDDLLNFKLIICPDEGFYRGGRFVFSFKVRLFNWLFCEFSNIVGKDRQWCISLKTKCAQL